MCNNPLDLHTAAGASGAGADASVAAGASEAVGASCGGSASWGAGASTLMIPFASVRNEQLE